jgi:adenylosuccinate synthase
MTSDIVVIGLQYGDEGKGRMVDLLACAEESLVVRYGGGPNAGHSVVVNGREFRFHNLPSGIASGQRCLIGGPCVVDLSRLEQEIQRLGDVPVLSYLLISARTHVIMPYHVSQDMAEEEWRRGSDGSGTVASNGGTGVIGTTHRGVGPCYSDKATRIGFRIGDLLFGAEIATLLRKTVSLKRDLLKHCYNYPVQDTDSAFNSDEILALVRHWRSLFGHLIVDDDELIHKVRKENQARLIFEGAQALGIDSEYGRYPFVTSSVTSVGGAITAGAYQPLVIGVTKCYAVAVGEGPMPTELTADPTDRIVARGKEYGTTTGRKRRVGWIDLPLLRRAVRVNKVTTLCVTNLDVLAGLDQVGICTQYRVGDRLLRYAPFQLDEWTAASAEIRFVPGWPEIDWEGVAAKGWSTLPAQIQLFIEALTREIGIEVSLVTFGRDRKMFVSRGSLSYLSRMKGY